MRAWTYSYLLGLLACVDFLARPRIPVRLSVIITQALILTSAWLNLAAARVHTGRPNWPLAYPVWALLIILGLSSYLTWHQPEPMLHLALGQGAGGARMLLSALAMLTAEIRGQPEATLQRMDEATYRAKANGRNQVELAWPPGA